MKILKSLLIAGALATGAANASAQLADTTYTPSPENIQARQQFSDSGFGIFIHWGIYSMFAQGEWYLQDGLTAHEYAKAARGFYPADFDADKWVRAIKEAGAKYICFTSRHHDGFSMFHTAQSPFNIVDATPFGRDIVKELADACHRHGIKLHLYYSHLDWTREDYPIGRTGRETGRDTSKADWASYYGFMNRQLTELLTNYGEIGAIWFDGCWDHDQDSTRFNWELEKQYDLIHSLQPACLIGNNHHWTPVAGEDIQIFERDLPGENHAGLSGQEISTLPLETCETFNGSWGYRIKDQGYKTTRELIHYLVKAAGMGANLLLNMGPQPNGELPAVALGRLKEVGQWLADNGETFYATTAGDFPAQEWGTTTRKGDRLFVHLLTPSSTDIRLPLTCKVKSAVNYADRTKVKFTKEADGSVTLHLASLPADTHDHIIELVTSSK